ncbi:hypothetical protein GEMRC1_012187 [Eukaryota sp. GEM-RC1]
MQSSMNLPRAVAEQLLSCKSTAYLASTPFFTLLEQTLKSAPEDDDQIAIDLSCFISSSSFIYPFLFTLYAPQYASLQQPPSSPPQQISSQTLLPLSTYECSFQRGKNKSKSKYITLYPHSLFFTSTPSTPTRPVEYSMLRLLTVENGQFQLPVTSSNQPFLFLIDQNTSDYVRKILVSSHHRFIYWNNKFPDFLPSLSNICKFSFISPYNNSKALQFWSNATLQLCCKQYPWFHIIVLSLLFHMKNSNDSKFKKLDVPDFDSLLSSFCDHIASLSHPFFQSTADHIKDLLLKSNVLDISVRKLTDISAKKHLTANQSHLNGLQVIVCIGCFQRFLMGMNLELFLFILIIFRIFQNS